MPKLKTSELISVGKAAEIVAAKTGEPVETAARRLRQAIVDGHLPALRIGRPWAVEAADARAFAKRPRRPQGRPREKRGKAEGGRRKGEAES